jgi:RNA polymerase sigma-70 factor (ECF subfamily)
MAGGQTSAMQRYIRQIATHAGSDHSDRQLLERYVTAADQVAFAALVRRHGPLVLGVCTRILGGGPDAEDAFQATFLVLVRKARCLSAPDALGPWLYGVACRTALKVRAARARRQQREMPLADLAAPEAALWRDLRPLLDELIHQLPHRYRAAFVLCYLEGKSNREAAHILGCPPGTIFSRLAWARDRLQKQLRRRGIVPASGVLAAWLVESAALAAVPIASAVSTSHAAAAFAAGPAAVAGGYSGPAAALAEGVLRAMFLTKLKIVLLVLATIGIAGLGTVTLTRLASASESQIAAVGPPVQPAAAGGDEAKTDRQKLQGSWAVVAVTENGREIAEDEVKARNAEIVFAGDKLTVQIRGKAKEFTYRLDPARKPRHIDMVEDGMTSKGIYLLEKGTLKICMAKDNDERPAEFTAPSDSNRVLLVLEKRP